MISETSGLTLEEQLVIEHLVEAWKAFLAMNVTGGDNNNDFRHAIHDCQRIIAQRALARLYPDFWRE